MNENLTSSNELPQASIDVVIRKTVNADVLLLYTRHEGEMRHSDVILLPILASTDASRKQGQTASM